MRTRAAYTAVAALVLGAASVFVATTPASAAPLTVTTTDDVVDGGDGLLSLREAVSSAASGDEIILAAGGTYSLTICGGDAQEDANADGDLDVGPIALTIRSDGDALATIEQTCPEERVLQVTDFDSDLTVQGLRITGGSISASGAGIMNIDGGDLAIVGSVITDNESLNDNDGGGLRGPADLTSSAIVGNRADALGGGVADAGGLWVNSTISGNEAGFAGGGLWVSDVELVHVTLVGNTAPEGANVYMSGDGAEMAATATVIGDPAGGGDDCSFDGGPTVTSNGYNVDSDGSCGFGGGPGDAPSTAALGLGALADNGGATPTLLPTATSPLVDAVPAADCSESTDQRGGARPSGDGCDVGAVELVIVPETTPPPAAQPVAASPDFTG